MRPVRSVSSVTKSAVVLAAVATLTAGCVGAKNDSSTSSAEAPPAAGTTGQQQSAGAAAGGSAAAGSGGSSAAGGQAASGSAASGSGAADGSGAAGSGAAAPGGGGNANPVNADAKDVTLTIATNAVKGGKNDAEATWITETVIPGFIAEQKAKGVNAKVTFNGSGVDDPEYKTKLQLGLKAGGAADVFAADGIWLGELAGAGYVKPLNQVATGIDSWDGWKQISDSVRQSVTYQGQVYGLPNGTDGRVLYFNKKVFQQAGLPADWQPTSWDDILAAGEKLKGVDGVTPIQINAGTAMTEATTAQGFLPLLVGTGKPLFDDKAGTWQGATPNVKSVLGFYGKLYGDGGLGDATLQQDNSGRDQSFELFAKGQIGILAEGDYFWRSVICPDKETCGATSMADRNSTVGWAKIPAEKPGSGVNGQDFVSVSGGSGLFLNPKSQYPQQAWELVQYMLSAKAQEAMSKLQVRISARDDVNAATLANDPLLSFIAKDVLPITTYRPSDEKYNAVSTAIQQATLDVVTGTSPDEAAATYAKSLEKIVGADKVSSE